MIEKLIIDFTLESDNYIGYFAHIKKSNMHHYRSF